MLECKWKIKTKLYLGLSLWESPWTNGHESRTVSYGDRMGTDFIGNILTWVQASPNGWPREPKTRVDGNLTLCPIKSTDVLSKNTMLQMLSQPLTDILSRNIDKTKHFTHISIPLTLTYCLRLASRNSKDPSKMEDLDANNENIGSNKYSNFNLSWLIYMKKNI